MIKNEIFKPLQPTVKNSSLGVLYEQFMPHEKLQNIIHCYWQLKTKSSLEQPFVYNVVADGCIDVFFNLKNTDENYVIGLYTKSIEFKLGTDFDYFGIRFLPTILPQLFKINAKQLSNKYEHLSNFIPYFSEFISGSLSRSHNIIQTIDCFNNFLVEKVYATTFDYDHRFYNALKIIYSEKGNLQIATHLNTGISQRQLRRLFEYYIGASPKEFCKIIKFQNVLESIDGMQINRQNKVYDHNSYYDQAHFIKNFKKFYGKTPFKAQNL